MRATQNGYASRINTTTSRPSCWFVMEERYSLLFATHGLTSPPRVQLEQVRLRSTSSKKLSYSPHSNADLTVSFSFSTEDAAAIVLSSIRGEVLQQVSCLDESWESLLRTDEASVALRRAPPIKKPAVAQPIHSRGREQVAATAPSPVRLSSSTTSSGQQDLGFAPNNTGSSSVQASILEALSAKAGALLQTLDRLKQRSCLSDLKLVFPQIVVLGEESSGKSSVLERLSMCEFFPRGEGICTRMPIEFEMIHKSEQEMHDFCTARKVPFVSNDCHCLVSSKRRTGTVHEYGLFGATTVRDHVKAIMDHEVKCNNGGSSLLWHARCGAAHSSHAHLTRCSRSDRPSSQHCNHRTAGS